MLLNLRFIFLIRRTAALRPKPTRASQSFALSSTDPPFPTVISRMLWHELYRRVSECTDGSIFAGSIEATDLGGGFAGLTGFLGDRIFSCICTAFSLDCDRKSSLFIAVSLFNLGGCGGCWGGCCSGRLKALCLLPDSRFQARFGAIRSYPH